VPAHGNCSKLQAHDASALCRPSEHDSLLELAHWRAPNACQIICRTGPSCQARRSCHRARASRWQLAAQLFAMARSARAALNHSVPDGALPSKVCDTLYICCCNTEHSVTRLRLRAGTNARSTSCTPSGKRWQCCAALPKRPARPRSRPTTLCLTQSLMQSAPRMHGFRSRPVSR
jgi:hypothetical protein